MRIIKREQYLQKVRPYFGKQLIKVLTGQRRCGKSYMLRQIRDALLNENARADIIFIICYFNG